MGFELQTHDDNYVIDFAVGWSLRKALRILAEYRDADKSPARPGRKQDDISVRMSWISFSALPCRVEKLDDSSRLDVVEIARVAWYASELIAFLVGLRTYQHYGIYHRLLPTEHQ